jgi:serine/threonine-protein kinase
MSDDVEQSRSRFFSVQDGTILLADQALAASTRSERLPSGIIDQKYQILGLLGEGGMGAVFRARHLMLNKDVALKTFKSANLTEEARLRFQREAQAIAKLSHKNIIQVFDFGLAEDSVPYYTMEYISGETLADRIKRNGPLTAAEAIPIFIQIGEGLSLAHSKGIIHRDLKPANLFIETSISAKGKIETVKIVDFGIASLTNQALEGQKLTTLGAVFGSPLYMSPEQAMGRTITERADIYSLGCTLFEVLTGRPPFRGTNALETIMQHQSFKPPTLKEASGGRDYPATLERAVATMLAKSPEDRQPSMDEVAKDLSQLIKGQTMVADRPVQRANKATETPGFGAPEQQTKQNETLAKNQLNWLLALGTIVLLIGVGAIWYWSSMTHTPSEKLPYCKTEKGADGKNYVVFKFPTDLDLGTFTDVQFPNGTIEPRGEVRWLVDQPPDFQPSAAFLQNPNCLDVFRPNYLSGLNFGKCRRSQKNSTIMRQIGRLTGLRRLNIESSTITDADLSELNKLTDLKALNLNDTNIDGKALGKIPQVRQLTSIEFCQCEGAVDLVAALKNSPSITHLYLDGDPLTPAAFETIGKLPNLKVLQVRHSGMQTSDLVSLTSLTKLKRLDAQEFHMTREAMGPLKLLKQKGLQILQLTNDGLTPTAMAQIKMIIPGAQFHNPKTFDNPYAKYRAGSPSAKEAAPNSDFAKIYQ